MSREELEDLVKRAYFACDTKNNHPDGIYPAEELDLVEFAQKLLELDFKRTIVQKYHPEK